MDAIYQCFKNKKTVEFVIANFFKNGGKKLHLISDYGGMDFSYLQNNYPNQITYSKNDINTWANGKGWKKDKSLAITWLTSLYNGLQNLNDQFVMILEDDVLLTGDISNIIPKYDIVGSNPNYFINIPLPCQMFINTFRNTPACTYYVGNGGSIFNRLIFLNEYNYFLNIINTHFDTLYDLSNGLVSYSDCCLTMLYLITNHSVGECNDHIETWYDITWRTSNKKIIHRFKHFYTDFQS